MRLSDVMDGNHGVVIDSGLIGDREITGLTCDSRRVEPGFLFAALPGSRADGRAFIADALERGAAAVLAPPGTELENEAGVPLITDHNPRRQYALMAARFFAEQPATVAAVTGTNGKTSVVTFLGQLWAKLGLHAASAGTLGIATYGFAAGDTPRLEHQIALTTPDSVDLHRSLSELAASGVERLAMEASSHGLEQYRLDGVRVAAAAFTNLSRDHLDYHGTMEEYLRAKVRLFSDILAGDGTAVVNADAPYSDAIRSAARSRGHRILDYGTEASDVRLCATETKPDGQVLDLQVMGEPVQVGLALLGGFQADNALCALALAVACGDDPLEAARALEHLEGAPGRVQAAGRHPNGAGIYVDYAHTPDALASILKALRPHTQGRLHVVFGCGGDRDPGKRPEMGDVACRHADEVIVTDDNPRTEDAAAIRAQVLAACPGAREFDDRAAAIAAAVADLQSDDILIVAGKGHERGQIVGDEIRPFDDSEVVADVLKGLER